MILWPKAWASVINSAKRWWLLAITMERVERAVSTVGYKVGQ